jgi:tetratricopeptide (TPR) repeat protein
MSFFLTIAAVASISAEPRITQSTDPNEFDCVMNQGADVIASCTAAIESGKRSSIELAGLFYCRANVYQDRHENTLAIADFSRSIRLDPNSLAYFGRAFAYTEEKDYSRAIADYSEVIRVHPKSSDAFYNRALAHDARKDYAHAIADYSESIRLGLPIPDGFYLRGQAEAKLGQTGASKADIARALSIDPNIVRHVRESGGPTRYSTDP